MTTILTEISNSILDEYLPALPLQLAGFCAAADALLLPDERTLRWLREQLRQAREQAAADGERCGQRHLHLGFGANAEFRQRILNGLGVLLAVEAAHESAADWPAVTDWLAQAAPPPLGLFNPERLWAATAPLWLLLQPAAGAATLAFGLPGEPAEALVQLPDSQAALYYPQPAQVPPLHLEQQLRLHHTPPASDAGPALRDGRVAATGPAPLLVWANNLQFSGLDSTLGGVVHRAAPRRPGRSHWELMQRSSALLFFGRVPAAGTGPGVAPQARLLVSATVRPRPLPWGALSARLHGVSAVPAQAAWFGQPEAQTVAYDDAHFYATDDSAEEQRIADLLRAYRALQETCNEQRAGADELPLLPLPWNLLHWIGDEASGEAVHDYVAARYREQGVGTAARAALLALVRPLTEALARLRPAWRQLAALAAQSRAAGPAFVVVPTHLHDLRHWRGFTSLYKRLLGARADVELGQLEIIGFSQLGRVAQKPGQPVYCLALQGKYWWALRQLPPATALHWRLHRGLYHDPFCQEVARQHELEATALHYQLWPLTAYAPDPDAAAQTLAGQLAAARPALPAHHQPTRFLRPGQQPVPGEPTEAADAAPGSEPTPRLGQGMRPGSSRPAVRPRPPQVTPDEEPTDDELRAARRFGQPSPATATAAELDDTELDDTELDDTELDEPGALALAEAEEDAALERYGAVAAAEEAPAPARGTPAAAARRAQVPRVWLNGTDHGPASRLVWKGQEANGQQHLFRQPLGELAAGDWFLNELYLRQVLRRPQTATQASLSDAALAPEGIPFWKWEMSRCIKQSYQNHPERLYRKLQGKGLSVLEAQFRAAYLAQNPETGIKLVGVSTRAPGTWHDRRVICRELGQENAAEWEMKMTLLGRDHIPDASRQAWLNEFNQARRTLWDAWQQLSADPERLEWSYGAVQAALTAHEQGHAGCFAALQIDKGTDGPVQLLFSLGHCPVQEINLTFSSQ